jgi:hypothetical protein
VVVNDVEDCTEFVFEGFIGQCIKSSPGGWEFISVHILGQMGFHCPWRHQILFFCYMVPHMFIEYATSETS